MFIDGSSRTAWCGQAPVSTPTIRSVVQHPGQRPLDVLLVLAGHDVVGHHDHRPTGRQQPGHERLHQRRLARADGSPDADR